MSSKPWSIQASWHGYPRKVRVDNGPEFTSAEFVQWAHQHGVYIDYTQPGCPYQNAYIERFNRTYRQEVLDLYLFTIEFGDRLEGHL